MKKIAYLVLSALVFSLVSCHSRGAAAAPSALPSGKETSEIIRQETPIKTSEEEKKDAPIQKDSKSSADDKSAPVWNTSDTDVSHVDIHRKLIAFTFDDAPDSTIKSLLQAFASFNKDNPDCPASATFFCNGIYIDSSNFSMLEAAYGAGFELGNHTDSHKNLTKLPSESIKKEIEAVDKILQKIDGKEKHLVRVPYGCFNDRVLKQADAPLIDWQIDTEDWKGISADKIFTAVYKDRCPGAIVLMHDGYKHTVEAVKLLLPALKKDGYQVVTVSQLSKALDCPFFAGKIYTHVKQQ